MAKGTSKTEIKVVLVADMVGFSGIAIDAHLPTFVRSVLDPISTLMRQYKTLDQVNTWGDGLFALFDNTVECCRFALQLRDLFKSDLVYDGLPVQLDVRVAVHLGQIFRFPDRVRSVKGALGRAIVLAARVEPIVKPGEVWVTEQVMAAVEAEKVGGFCFDPQGEVRLPKDYGECRLFTLCRDGEPRGTSDSMPRGDDSALTVAGVEKHRAQLLLTQRYTEVANLIQDCPARTALDELYLHAQSLCAIDSLP